MINKNSKGSVYEKDFYIFAAYIYHLGFKRLRQVGKTYSLSGQRLPAHLSK